ncbi:MAG: hypothetical protein A2V64_10505 [Bacteroidetes bacterium RBG_13_43_22]|nr:MAG: hypothetical protein A2V64_10505 [Bacteroidetes bacterium RBG_13_43_22]
MGTKHQDDILALIARNLSDEADLSEVAQLREWIECSETNKRYFKQVKNIWEVSDKQLDPNMINTPEALGKVLNRISEVSPGRSLWYYWQKIAAVIILPLAVSTILLLYLNSHKTSSLNEPVYNEVYAAFGTRSALKLADSTLVWLNSGSSLRYPDKFDNKNRHVYLKGEACFEVKSDVSNPFIVQTSTLLVKATGTKFNIQEFDLTPVTEVTLVSGKVFVHELDNIKNPTLITELCPNQHLKYNRETKTKSIVNEDVYKYIAWKDGKLIFRNEPLSEAVKKIGQVFKVDIELQGTELQDYRYWATFQDESLDEILKLLKLSSPIDFRELKRNPLPDGSFPKKKIIIFPAKPTIHN